MESPSSPHRSSPLLRLSYSLIAPLYNLAIDRPMRKARSCSLRTLPGKPPGRVLLSGIGTGLDLPLLPASHQYVGLDFIAAMLARANGWFRRIVLRKIDKKTG